MGGPRLTYDLDALLDDYRADELTVPELAAKYGMSRNSLAAIAKAHGLRRSGGPIAARRPQPIADDLALVGGEWVRDGLVWRWVA